MHLSKFVKVIFFIIYSSCALGQDFKTVDATVDNYPKDIISSEQLAQHINKNFSAQAEKSRAVFRWVATNISYDSDSANMIERQAANAFSYTTEKERAIKEKKFREDLIRSAWASKKAICHGYAFLVQDLCERLGLEAKTIIGNLKSDPAQIGIVSTNPDHAWNVIKIDNEWKFVDATLAAGYMTANNTFKFYFNDSYFFTNPETFFLNHFPQDKKWIFLNKNSNDFAKLPVFFGFYLQSTIKINKPDSGIYSVNSGDFILSFTNLQVDSSIYYLFESENKKHYLDTSLSDQVVIPVRDRASDLLYIFIDNRPMVAYKLIQ